MPGHTAAASVPPIAAATAAGAVGSPTTVYRVPTTRPPAASERTKARIDPHALGQFRIADPADEAVALVAGIASEPGA